MRVATASFFLATRTLKNRLLFTLKRLKRPRYLLSAILSIVYFGMMFTRNRAFTEMRHWTPQPGVDEVTAVLASVAVFFAMVVPWAFPWSKAGLEFTEPEIQFLFPSPFSRRELMLYKMIRTVPAFIVSAIVFRLFGRGGATLFGTFVVVIVLDVYMTFVRCARARLRLIGIGWLPRLAGVIAFLSGIGYLIYRQAIVMQWIVPKGAKGFATLLKQAGALFEGFPQAIFFALPRMIAVTATSHDFVRASLFALLTIAFGVGVFYLGSSLDIDFEEASIEASKRKQDRIAERRGARSGERVFFRRLPAPFKLAPTGQPAVAIFWKNLIAAGRVFAGQLIGLGAMLVFTFGFAIFAHSSRTHELRPVTLVVAMICLFFAGALFIIGPSMFRNDLRSDLEKIEVLRALPLNGFSIVAAEVAAPAVLIAAMQLLFVVVGALMLYSSSHSLSLQWTGVVTTIALLIGPPLIVLQLLIHNAWAVMLPGWNLIPRHEQRGFAASGQVMLVLLGQALVLGVTLIPAAIGFFGSFWVLKLLDASRQTTLAGALVIPSAILVLEAWAIMQWLGQKFEDLDLANDDLAPKG